MADMRPRIVVAANAVLDQGGQGLNLRHLVEALEQNFDLALFCKSQCSKDPRPMTAVPGSRRVRIIERIPLLRRRRDLLGLIEPIHFDRWVAARLPEADAIVAGAGSALATFQAAKARGMKCVLDVTTTHVDHFGEVQDRELPAFGGRPSWHPRLRARTRHEYVLADAIRVMSAIAKKTLTDRGVPPHKVFVATPPVADPAAPQAAFSDPIFRVEFVGLFEPAKGFHYLIEAFNRLGRADSELTLWGGPGLRGVANYLADQRSRNPGIKVSNQNVRSVGFDKVYARSSVLVLPSLADGFGYVAGEAMSCGLPVIVTTATGAADLVEDGVNGFVVPPADPISLTDRLGRLAADPSLNRRMGAAARKTANRYGLEQYRASWVSAMR